MTLDLLDYQFSLTVAGTEVAFGDQCPVYFDGEGGWDPGATPLTTNDQQFGNRDGLAFGRDYLGGPIHSWQLNTNGEDAATALSLAAPLQSLWKANAIRKQPGAMGFIRYCLDGRLRRFYGRPRGWGDSPLTNAFMQGFRQHVATFQAVDDHTYGDQLQSVTIAIAPGTAVGLMAPLTAPLTAQQRIADRQGFITNEGDADAYPIITLRANSAGLVNPYVYTDNWRIDFKLTLSAGQSIIIDTQPWSRSITRGGANISGSMRTKQRLTDLVFPPGTHEFIFGGIDGSNTANCQINWRHSYDGI